MIKNQAPSSKKLSNIFVCTVYKGAEDDYFSQYPINGETSYSGKIMQSPAPGKIIPQGRDGKKYNRNLKADLMQYQKLGITLVVCLLNKYELRTLGIDLDNYLSIAQKIGLEVRVYPIMEMSIPSDVTVFHDSVVAKVLSVLQSGSNVLIHCRGGVGRASTVAACVMSHIFPKAKSKDLITLLRKRRYKTAVESTKQEDYIKKYIQKTRTQAQSTTTNL